MEILSKNNPLIKDLAKLKQKKYRTERNKMLVEGERAIKELIARNAEIDYIFYADSPLSSTQNQIKCSEIVLRELSQTVSPSNYVAVVSIPNMVFKPPSTSFLVLENVLDPGNMGTLIRTSLAFDFRTIYLVNCVDPTNDKVLRSCMGNFWDVNLIECSIDDIESLSKKYPLVVADMGGEKLENTPKLNSIFGIVLGNEANGVSEKMRSLASHVVSISMKNNVESLNVAVAGAIIMNYFKGE